MIPDILLNKNRIWLDGVSNQDVGVVMQEPLRLSAPVPRVTSVSIPGRNGDLHYYDGSYENRRAEAYAFLLQENNVKNAFGRAHQWLMMSNGYRRLEDEEDLDHFLLARVKNGAEVAARMNRLAPFLLSFDCRPERFLKIGEEPLVLEIEDGVFDSFFKIENPTIFPAKPLYKFTCNGDGYFRIGTSIATMNGVSGDVYYDTETENAYNGTVNMNSYFSVYNPLICEGGEQDIMVSGNISRVEIIPRWWEL